MIKSGRVILKNRVRGDFPIGHNIIAEPGVYDAFVNPQGAVSIETEEGQQLGLRPPEFAWLERPTNEIKPQRCGNCGVYREVCELMVKKCPNCGDDEYDLYQNCSLI
ncbi:MAG: hypothetical protein PHI12_06755 [Dehalococcoidales bacterium]|nr:hypothetical protein [Dehalococcoidales bacterium]